MHWLTRVLSLRLARRTPRPPSLFRYRRDNEWLNSYLVDSEIYFPLLDELNDPCEVFYKSDYDLARAGALNAFRAWREEQRRQHAPKQSVIDPVIAHTGATREQILAQAEYLLYGPEEEVFEKVKFNLPLIDKEKLRKTLRIVELKTIGICSFSELGASPFMSWFYAEEHKGVCLEFSSSAEPFNSAKPVHYSPNAPVLRLDDPPDRRAETLVRTKSLAWRQEREWRIFAHFDITGRIRRFDSRALISVAFCPKICSKSRTRISELLAPRVASGALKLYDLQVNPERYEFNRVVIKV